MTSFLVTNRSKESYEQRINTEPTGTQKCRRYSVKNFEAFVSETYDGRSTDDVVQELFVCKANKGEEFEDALYGDNEPIIFD